MRKKGKGTFSRKRLKTSVHSSKSRKRELPIRSSRFYSLLPTEHEVESVRAGDSVPPVEEGEENLWEIRGTRGVDVEYFPGGSGSESDEESREEIEVSGKEILLQFLGNVDVELRNSDFKFTAMGVLGTEYGAGMIRRVKAAIRYQMGKGYVAISETKAKNPSSGKFVRQYRVEDWDLTKWRKNRIWTRKPKKGTYREMLIKFVRAKASEMGLREGKAFTKKDVKKWARKVLKKKLVDSSLRSALVRAIRGKYLARGQSKEFKVAEWDFEKWIFDKSLNYAPKEESGEEEEDPPEQKRMVNVDPPRMLPRSSKRLREMEIKESPPTKRQKTGDTENVPSPQEKHPHLKELVDPIHQNKIIL